MIVSSVYGGYNYNENYTNLHLETNGWCSNIEMNFKVWNETDYENQEEIERDLCKKGCEDDCDGEEDCFECDNDCLEYHNIKDAEVKIYNGPMDGMPILLDTTTNSSGEFTYKFNEPNQYLIEIYPDSGHYNDYHDTLYIDICKHAQDTTIKKLNEEENPPEPQDVEFSYDDKGFTIALKQTTINDSSVINIDENIEVSNRLNNTLKIFEITSQNSNFEEIEVIVNIEEMNDKDVELKKYDSLEGKWNDYTFDITGSTITFTSDDMGIFSINEITKKEEVVEEEINEDQNNEEEQTGEETGEEANEDQDDETEPNSNVTNPLGTKKVVGIIVAITALVILIMFFALKKKKPVTKPIPAPKSNKEVLSTYQQTYNKASEYVKKYKENYRRDQLYRSLENVNVPKDIIDRVFSEEFE
jgi:hypothetical protein